LRCVALLARSLTLLTYCVVVFLDIKRLHEAFYPSVCLSVRSSVRPSVGVCCCCWWVSFAVSLCILFCFCFPSSFCLQTSSRSLLLIRNTQLDREETQRDTERKNERK
jgi:hypothetical protein